MKKILSLILIVLSFGFVTIGCSSDDNDNEDYDTVAEVFEFTNINFNYDEQADEFYFKYANSPIFPLYSGEHLLIYVQSGWDNGPVWRLLPNYANYAYTPNEVYEMKYNYDFTRNDFEIFAFCDPMPPRLLGITFRVVIIPGKFANKTAVAPVDYNDYNAVIKYYNIDDNNVKQIIPKK